MVVNDVETHTNALFICIPADILYLPPLGLHVSSEFIVNTLSLPAPCYLPLLSALIHFLSPL